MARSASQRVRTGGGHRLIKAGFGSGAFLSSSTIVDADPSVRRNLIVESRIDAEVPLHAHGVAIGPTGRVRGDIYGAMIRVEGEVIGDLFGEVQVRVCYTAEVRGNIMAPNVIVEEGARFKGRVLVQELDATTMQGLGEGGTAAVIA